MGVRGVLSAEDRISFSLMSLYENYGYKKYKMSKFEEYDLYLQNKNFLKSEQVIAFNDPTGKLMALKPDVTLSIAKNTGEDETEPKKLFYSENVYRVSGNMHEFREIPQIGLEYVGEVDLYSLFEVLVLAKQSLALIGDDYVLDVSHMGLSIGLLEQTGLPSDLREEISGYIGTKNSHEIKRICTLHGVDPDLTEKMVTLSSLYGGIDRVLPLARELVVNDTAETAVSELEELCAVLKECGEDTRVNIDFSIVSDMNYYNGITFRGYVNGIPGSILSGGRYDNLMKKMGKNTGAAGFAVYLDLLAYLDKPEKDSDADVLLVYEAGTPVSAVVAAFRRLSSEGNSVRMSSCVCKNIKYNRLVRLNKEGETTVG